MVAGGEEGKILARAVRVLAHVHVRAAEGLPRAHPARVGFGAHHDETHRAAEPPAEVLHGSRKVARGSDLVCVTERAVLAPAARRLPRDIASAHVHTHERRGRARGGTQQLRPATRQSVKKVRREAAELGPQHEARTNVVRTVRKVAVRLQQARER